MRKIQVFVCVLALCLAASPSFSGEYPKSQTSQPQALPIEEFTISRKGDLELSCTELFHEAQAMSMVIEDTTQIKNNSEMQSRGISAAGAVGSFLVGTVTGGIGLAVGGLLLDRSVGGREDDADKIQDIAEQRRTFIMGIYTAQECEGDIYAMIEKNHPTTTETEKTIPDIEPAASDAPQKLYND